MSTANPTRPLRWRTPICCRFPTSPKPATRASRHSSPTRLTPAPQHASTGNKYIDRYGFSLKAPGTTPEYGSATNTIDAPVMRYGEVLLNWIEAKGRTRRCYSGPTSTKSINQLRARPLDAVAGKRDSRTPHPWYSLKSTQPSTPTATPMPDPLVWKSAANAASKWYLNSAASSISAAGTSSHYMDNRKYPDTMRGLVDQLQRGTNRNSCRRQDRCIPCRRHTCGIRRQQRCRNGSFYEPLNAQPRLNFSDRSYLYPIGTKVIEAYTDRNYTISQTKGW